MYVCVRRRIDIYAVTRMWGETTSDELEMVKLILQLLLVPIIAHNRKAHIVLQHLVVVQLKYE